MSMDTETNNYVPRRLHRKPRRVGRVVLLAALMVVVSVLGVGGAYASKLAGALGQTQTWADSDVVPTNSDRPWKDPGDKSMNILLLGADKSQSGETVSVESGGTDQRSDSMMLVHIPADRKNVYVISLMRDLWVDIPGHGHAKLNAAMQYGGVKLLWQTVEKITNTSVDHVAMVDFDAFRDLTNTIGGVTVDNPVAFCAYKTTPDVCFEKGKIEIQGQRALKWVRERHAFLRGDYQRVANQQQFLKQVFKKVLSPEVLGDPNKLVDTISSVTKYVTTDKGFDDPALQLGLLMQMKDLRSNDIRSFTLHTLGTGTMGGQSVVLFDQRAATDLGNAMKTGTMDAYYKAAVAQERADLGK